MDLGIKGKNALVCAARSGLTGFVAGQNFLIDGGAYPGTY